MNYNRNYAIPAREVQYKNVTFRSTLEARWAVFFSSLGIDWFYEPAQYQISSSMRYTPDFYLTLHNGIFVEIKPTPPTSLERKKMRLLCDHLGNVGVILNANLRDFSKKKQGISEFFGERAFPRRDVMLFENISDKYSKQKYMFLSQMHEQASIKSGWRSNSENIQRAYQLALSERF